MSEAGNGRVALARLAEARPDVIVLDLMMPEMDGFEFLDEMRSRAEWREIPVLVVTAKDLTAEERHAASTARSSVCCRRARRGATKCCARSRAPAGSHRARPGAQGGGGNANEDPVRRGQRRQHLHVNGRLDARRLHRAHRHATARREWRWRRPNSPT